MLEFQLTDTEFSRNCSFLMALIEPADSSFTSSMKVISFPKNGVIKNLSSANPLRFGLPCEIAKQGFHHV